MQARDLNRGDRVQCNVKGREFTARFLGRSKGELLRIEPDDRQITYRFIRSRQVKEVIERG